MACFWIIGGRVTWSEVSHTDRSVVGPRGAWSGGKSESRCIGSDDFVGLVVCCGFVGVDVFRDRELMKVCFDAPSPEVFACLMATANGM